MVVYTVNRVKHLVGNMKTIPLVCSRMAAVASDYCDLIDNFNGLEYDRSWLARMGKLLPRLHVAIIALTPPSDSFSSYRFPDDDKRCELYMRLHWLLQSDQMLQALYGQSSIQLQFCDHLADDFTDIYYDLRLGLELLAIDPVKATNLWLCSFYLHWGQHLMDAECRLHAVETGDAPLRLPVWDWAELSQLPA